MLFSPSECSFVGYQPSLRAWFPSHARVMTSSSWTRAHARAMSEELKLLARALDDAERAMANAENARDRGEDADADASAVGAKEEDENDDDAKSNNVSVDRMEFAREHATTLAMDCALGLSEALMRVRPYAGEGFRDVEEAARRGARRASEDGGDANDESERGNEGNNKYAMKTKQGLPGMRDAIGELRGMLKKVGANASGEGEGGNAEDVDGKVSIPALAPGAKVEKPQWMIDLAAKNAAKRALDGGA